MNIINVLVSTLTVCIFSCSSENHTTDTSKSETKPMDTLKFEMRGFNNGVELLLLPNNRFLRKKYVFGCLGGGYESIILGTYVIKNNELRLNANKIQEYNYLENNEKNQRVYKLDTDSLLLKKHYYIVNGSNRTLLLSSEYLNDFHKLQSDLNDFQEYKNWKENYSPHDESPFFLISDTLLSNSYDKNELPDSLKAYLN